MHWTIFETASWTILQCRKFPNATQLKCILNLKSLKVFQIETFQRACADFWNHILIHLQAFCNFSKTVLVQVNQKFQKKNCCQGTWEIFKISIANCKSSCIFSLLTLKNFDWMNYVSLCKFTNVFNQMLASWHCPVSKTMTSNKFHLSHIVQNRKWVETAKRKCTMQFLWTENHTFCIGFFTFVAFVWSMAHAIKLNAKNCYPAGCCCDVVCGWLFK